ncbi:hypothetical protein FGO68_gene8368 [Halteria grandinella]|uniref:Rhodanese domain-containing protein n=1 Tax=Halteria grandinella TaxID=5974 RepID=A0A8J8NJ73_HALGN|nr:hypothetical protein FGO68_gene8368 [Halteria grandinella]
MTRATLHKRYYTLLMQQKMRFSSNSSNQEGEGFTLDPQAHLNQITVTQLIDLESSNAHLRLLDIRDRPLFDKAHPFYATHIQPTSDQKDFEIELLRTVPRLNTPLVLYCDKAGDVEWYHDIAIKMGYKQVWSVKRGFREFKHCGYPEMERAQGQIIAQEYIENFNRKVQEAKKTAGGLKERIGDRQTKKKVVLGLGSMIGAYVLYKYLYLKVLGAGAIGLFLYYLFFI